MTARSKKQRQRNLSIKREKQKVKELARLRKTVGLPELMDTEQIQVVNADKIAKKVSLVTVFYKNLSLIELYFHPILAKEARRGSHRRGIHR